MSSHAELASQPPQSSGHNSTTEVRALPAYLSAASAARQQQLLQLQLHGSIGQGTFGVIYRGRVLPAGPVVAIKKVLQDQRYKNRELQLMNRVGPHANLVTLYYYFFSQGAGAASAGAGGSSLSSSACAGAGAQLYLNLLMELLPESLCAMLARVRARGLRLSHTMVKVVFYQVLRGLAHLHSAGVCHRDIKSSNVLVDERTCRVKICDLGSAKELRAGEDNVSYISSRYYRAPELLFGATRYSDAIDLWSAGCVLAECLLAGECLFTGASSVDQLVAVIRTLGTPLPAEIGAMNAVYAHFPFPQVAPVPLAVRLPADTPAELLMLLAQLLRWSPAQRVRPLRALAGDCFAELRRPCCRLSEDRPLPTLFDFSAAELAAEPGLQQLLMPPHWAAHTRAAAQHCQAASDELGSATHQTTV